MTIGELIEELSNWCEDKDNGDITFMGYSEDAQQLVIRVAELGMFISPKIMHNTSD